MDSWFLAAVKKAPGNETMPAEDPLRRFVLGKLRNAPTQVICILLVITQATLLNYHLAQSYDNKLLFLWFIADAAVIAVFIVSFYLKEWRLEHVSKKHGEESGFAKGLPYAPLAWLIYSSLLGARVIDIFVHDLEQKSEILDLKSIICGTAIICIFFTWGHHHNHESLARRASIMSLVKLFTIDVLDTVDILDVLLIIEENHADFPKALEYVVLAIVTINLIRPSVSLTSLFIDHFAKHITSLRVKIWKSQFELMLLNIPLLVIRVYLAATYDESISVFLVKNILGIFFGLVEIYDCSYDIHSEKKKNSQDFTTIDEEQRTLEKQNQSGSDNGQQVTVKLDQIEI
ncbi:uncharacterized protein [Watersipora subatra]|uniref:uncharacterized protein n=1 Tax=Watersipora subatra TaxID=2589382 RepID=UPI00355AE1F4